MGWRRDRLGIPASVALVRWIDGGFDVGTGRVNARDLQVGLVVDGRWAATNSAPGIRRGLLEWRIGGPSRQSLYGAFYGASARLCPGIL